MKRVALYGGSFDPPHVGHEAVVAALQKLDFIDEIIVMPTFLNPFKDRATAPSNLRLQWLKKIFSSYENVTVSDFEVSLGRKVPTIETVRELRKEYEEIYLVLGADNLAHLQRWHNFDALKKMVHFIVATRDGVTIPKEYLPLTVTQDVSSTELRENIDISKLPKKCAHEIAHYYKEYNAKKS
jgi:nicotinate-nucleotide adenylyltransferase